MGGGLLARQLRRCPARRFGLGYGRMYESCIKGWFLDGRTQPIASGKPGSCRRRSARDGLRLARRAGSLEAQIGNLSRKHTLNIARRGSLLRFVKTCTHRNCCSPPSRSLISYRTVRKESTQILDTRLAAGQPCYSSGRELTIAQNLLMAHRYGLGLQ